MRYFLLASIMVLVLGAAADSAPGGWRTRGIANQTGPGIVWQRGYGQRGYGQRGYGWYRAPGDWRTYGTANRISPDGVWWRGYGRMGYGWYSAYGNYVGNDYSSIGFGYRNRSSGFNFNRTDNYGFTDPRAIGDRAR